MFFESNGVPRVVEVADTSSQTPEGGAKTGRGPAREKANPGALGSVAAPMAGEVIDVKVKPGAGGLLEPACDGAPALCNAATCMLSD